MAEWCATAVAACRWLRTAGLVALSLLAGPLSAAESDTLQRLVQTGRIVLGARDTALPLSYLGPAGEHMGYHHDICLRLVAAIRQRFNLPTLRVMTVPTTLANRHALLNNRTIDIDCGHNPVNPSALQQALMAHATFISDVRVMTRSEFAGRSLVQQAGRPVGVIVGSTAVPALRALTRNAQLKAAEVTGRNAGEVFAMLEQGRVEAVAFSTPYMLALRALAPEPDRFVLRDEVLRTEPVALMFRLDDEKLHALANEVLAALMRSGEMARLYDKWFMQAVPGLPQPVGLPLSPALRRLFSEPGSEMLDL